MSQSVLAEIRSLDPEADHQRIVFLSTRFEFPFDTTRALEFALFRTSQLALQVSDHPLPERAHLDFMIRCHLPVPPRP